MKTISDNSPQLREIYIKKRAQWNNKQRKTTQKMRGRQLKATTNSPRCRGRVWTGQGRGQGVANDNDAMNGQARPGAIQNQKAVPLVSPEWDRDRERESRDGIGGTVSSVNYDPDWPKVEGCLRGTQKHTPENNNLFLLYTHAYGDTFNGHRYVIHNNNLVIARQS